ncbi:MAG: hypothetical protein AAF683_04110 [Pseudomonadota bacterium]
MTGEELERMMFHWPSVIARADDPWARGFAASIARQARNPNWHPSPKQAAMMRRLVQQVFEGPEAEVIDEND